MKNTLNIGAKVGFLNNKNKFQWSKVISFENDKTILQENNKYKRTFEMETTKILEFCKQGVIKIVSNCKLY